MRIAIFMANTDESDFAQSHPKDGQKFIELLKPARPAWQFDVYSVKDGLFPDSLDGLDGVIITGSPASVHDADEWIPELEEWIRNIYTASIPMFGACFGHQAITTAFGGTVSDNPDGWVMGAVATYFNDLDATITLHAAHKEQVTTLPENAVVVATTPGCPIAGFTMGDLVLTTQYHPEMTSHFIESLLAEYRNVVGDDVADHGLESLVNRPDAEFIAEWIVTFFNARAGNRS